MGGALADLVRDIFGNPFRPVAAQRSWITTDVLSLARGVYDECAFDRMPVLADESTCCSTGRSIIRGEHSRTERSKA
jgi:hypothetical protein